MTECKHGKLTRQCYVCDLEAELAAARADNVAALDLVARIREALGDNGKRMQPELIEYAAQCMADAARYRCLRE